jgi:hypothetical protein
MFSHNAELNLKPALYSCNDTMERLFSYVLLTSSKMWGSAAVALA